MSMAARSKRIIDRYWQDEIITFVHSINGGTKDKGAVGIGVEQGGKILGAITLDQFNGANINMHVAAVSGNWLTPEFLWYMFHYPFEILSVKRVTGLICASNLHAQKFAEKFGFRLEAVLKDASPKGDLLIYVMFKHECRFLKRPYG